MRMLVFLSIIFWFFPFLIGIIIPSITSFDALYDLSQQRLVGFNKEEYIFKFNDNISSFTIIHNNIIVVILLVVGAFSIGVMTILNLIVNGLFAGIIIGIAINSGMSTYDVISLTLPHGIFELPALWLAGAAGLKGPQVFIRYLRGGKFVTKQDVKEFLILSLTSIILIIIAGIVEATITYQIFLDLSNNTKS